MQNYYELMVITRRERTGEEISHGVYTLNTQEEFENSDEIEELARKVGIDSESQTVATAVGIIRWLLKNDESVKGKYTFRKKKQ